MHTKNNYCLFLLKALYCLPMLLPLAYYGNPILRKKGKPVKEITGEIKELVHSMVETMHAHNGIGLAAPQVKKSLRIFIVCIPIPGPDDTWQKGRLLVFINPKILKVSATTWEHGEGCLSIPKLYGDVIRPETVTVEATDLEGNRFTEELSDMEARCCLHENDHINGVLFIDRVDKNERKKLESELKKIKNEHS